MKAVELVKPGDPANSAAKLNEIIAAINDLMKLGVGPGLSIRETAAGKVISALAPKVKSHVQNYDGGTLAELLQNQGAADADTWTRDTDDCPVSLQVITDIQYDNTTHKITFRTRTLEFDRGGNLLSISAESALVDITTAIACTAQL